MRQIYDFERYMPPALNENMLREEQRRRNVRGEMIMLALAAVLSQVVMALIGIGLFAVSPIFGAACFGYVAVSIAGSGVITIIYAQEGNMRSTF